MAKGYCRDPDEKRRRILFGSGKYPAKLSEMARETHIPVSTLKRYKKYPSMIPLEKLQKIIRWNNLDAEQIGELFR